MPESTSSQSSTPNPLNGSNNPDSDWHQEQGLDNAVSNGMTLEWIDLQSYGTMQTSEANNNIINQQIPNSINSGINQQVVIDPTIYIHEPYQSNTVPNGYTMNAPRRPPLHMSNGSNLIRAQNGQIIGGPNWVNQTPLARFISQSPGWTPPSKPTGGVKKQKRIRTAFTSQQMMDLEQEYARTRYLDRARRIELADILRLNERTIKIWFQNRRMKEKKDRLESLEDSEEASSTESSPEISNSFQAPVHVQEQFQNVTNEVYNRGGVYIEQYPVSSTTEPVPATSVSTLTHALNYPMYMPENQCNLQYQQVHFQMQQYPSPYGNEIQELSPELVPKPECPAVNVPSDINERSWDLSWIKSITTEDEY